MTVRRRHTPAHRVALVRNVPIEQITPDDANPRKPDAARLGLLRLSIAKLGFIMPLFVDTNSGLLLSGHQRTHVSGELNLSKVPVMEIAIKPEEIKGVNVLFNRATNDFTAFDTGSKMHGRLDLDEVLEKASSLPDFEGEDWFAINCKEERLAGVATDATVYDKKAVNLAATVMRMGIRIPAVISDSGTVVNGMFRLLAAKENNETTWPVIRIPDAHAEVALNFLNYLSMDYHVDGDFEKLLRYSAYRRPQNNRGAVPKAMRFWANGNRSLADRDSYGPEYWHKFREVHGGCVLDFGSGLSKAAPYLRTRGIDAVDFEPYRIDPEAEAQVPSPAYSRSMARQFLDAVANPKLRFDSIFLCSVLNSVPFARDRMCVLAIVHALSQRNTRVYGTCRDLSDYNYEYGGIRNANYFTFDSEPGVRIGDVMRNPKIQKFHSQDEARAMFSQFWRSIELWPGGNVFFFQLGAPMTPNPKVIAQALEMEFDLPYADGKGMGLVDHAKAAFSKRLGMPIK